MRNPRAEARDRLGGRYDVRVLEPSPPAVSDPPFFADDPVEGGEVVPGERPGARSWAVLSEDEASPPDLRSWCEDRWLVRGRLRPLPPAFDSTRRALHAVAEHVIAPCRFAANGRIGLRYTFRGFGTPFFGADRQIRVEDGELVDGDDRHYVTTLRAAAEAVCREAPADTGVYRVTTSVGPDEPLVVDPVAARALGDWFGFSTSLMEQMRAEASEADAPSRVQLWPEHFDVAVDIGPTEARAIFGGFPGDDEHPEPYVYVQPWGAVPTGAFWNQPFGASLPYSELLSGADALDFLRDGRDRLQAGR